MKAQLIAVIIVCLCITSALFIDPVNSAAVVTAAIKTSGTIVTTSSQQTVKTIVRHLGNPMPDWTDNIAQHVDDWVATYPWIKGGAIIIEVGDVAQILWFDQKGWNGHQFNATNGVISNECPWTFTQLKTLIDRFHYNGVSVILGIIGFAKPAPDWSNSDIWGWINQTHRELLFTHADGSLYGISNNKYVYPAPLNWFANFKSDDSASGAKKGDTLYDLFDIRLGQMIDAGLEWDGIFGSEGWGSVGNWGGGSKSEWIDASENAISQWANSDTKFHPTPFPINWDSYTLNQKVTWIQQNANSDWRGYWGYRYAKDLFANTHDLIKAERSNKFFIGEIFSPDCSWMDPRRGATWGGWSPDVGYNATWLSKYCSEDTYIYYIDSESCYGGQLGGQAELGKLQAYVAASVKSADPNFHTIIGMQLSQSVDNPLWVAKQEWLAQAQDYVWVNGIRYKAVDSNYCMIQYPDGDNGYLRGIWNDLFTWIDSMRVAMDNTFPEYLGPTYFAGIRTWSPGYWEFTHLSYTLAQWTFQDNYENHPEYFNEGMITLYIPTMWYGIQGGSLSQWQDTVLNNYANANINVILTINNWGNTPSGNMLGQVAFGKDASETKTMQTFHLQKQKITSADNQVNIHGTSTEQYFTELTSGYNNQKYTINGMVGDYSGYKGTTGYQDISSFGLSNASNLGIYYNDTSGRFLYMCLTSSTDYLQTAIPTEIINRAIYWTSEAPISIQDSMVDYKVFSKSGGSIIIPMMNHKDMGTILDEGVPIRTSISINATALDLGNENNYNVYWASNPANLINIKSWNNIAINLIGMADALVIERIR